MDLLVLFIVLNIINVILQTIKSICTVKGTPIVAALANAIAYFIYTYVLIYTAIDGISSLEKALVVAGSNLIGVFVVKWIEKKAQKDRLWKIEFTVKGEDVARSVDRLLTKRTIPHSYVKAGSHTIFNCYCATQDESASVKDVIEHYEGKYFVSESKTL